MSTRSRRSRARLPSSDFVTVSAMRPNSALGSRTFVPTIASCGFEVLQDAAEIFLRLAVAVLHRGVEIIDADGERAGDGALLVARIAAHHQSADRAAAEAEHREPHAGAAVDPHFHRHSSACLARVAADQ